MRRDHRQSDLEHSGRVERPQEQGQEKQMRLRLAAIHVHQAHLNQLTNQVFQMASLQGPKRWLSYSLQRRLCGFFSSTLLGCTSLDVVFFF